VPFVIVSGSDRELPPGPLAKAPRLAKPYLPEHLIAALAAARDAPGRAPAPGPP
jgi:hypothetical protein